MSKGYVCEVRSVNKEVVEDVMERMLEEGLFLKVSDTFKILGDPTRVKILYALSLHEMCVCDLSVLLGMSHSAISHQLRLLRNAGFVKYRREGKIVYYTLADEHVVKLIKMGIEHARE